MVVKIHAVVIPKEIETLNPIIEVKDDLDSFHYRLYKHEFECAHQDLTDIASCLKTERPIKTIEKLYQTVKL